MTSRAPAPAPLYTSGEYFNDPHRHREDASFKAGEFLRLISRALSPADTMIDRYVDVGCGSGDAARLVASGLRQQGYAVRSAAGYDVSPHVAAMQPADGVTFVNGDFCEADDHADLVTLFDVVEHVTDPLAFVRKVASRTRLIGFHIPLDDSINAAARDLFRIKVRNPGHLIFMDGVSALNLIAMAGLRVLDYEYTMAFAAPSGRASWVARAVTPLRKAAAKLSPWLLSKTLGGASLMVIALAPQGAQSATQGRRA